MIEWYIFGWTFIAMIVILTVGSVILDVADINYEPRN